MTIYGLSQSTGVERRLKVEQGGEGVVLTITDHVGGKERGRILVQPDDLLSTITDAPPGGSVVEGISPPHGAKIQLDVEVRRNEVLLRAHGGSEEASGRGRRSGRLPGRPGGDHHPEVRRSSGRPC